MLIDLVPPLNSPVVEKGTWMLAQPWHRFWNLFKPVVRIAVYSAQDASASVAAFALPRQTLSGGLYRVSYSLKLSRAATVSSSVGVTFGWTRGAASLTAAPTALTANVTTVVQTDSYLLRVDEGTQLTVAVTYASVGATAALYDLDVLVEAVPA